MDFRRTIPSRSRAAAASEPQGLHLLVMGPDVFETHRLPDTGQIVLGREPDVDVVLLDLQTSRKHARLHISTVLELEDLGSVNGTWLREEKLEPHVRVRVWPGEAIRIGGLVLMLQRQRPRVEARRVWPHHHFEALLAYQCERARLGGGGFAVARVRINEPITPARFAATLAPALEAADLIALYHAGDFEVLLPARGAERVRATVDRIRESLAAEGFTPRVVTASFPQDGRDPEPLMSALNDRVLGVKRLDVAGERLIVNSEAMRTMYALAMRAAAAAHLNVLVLGETGAGKEVLARAIHRASPRASARLVSLNCAALPESLLESELFGHEKGAFTGADRAKPGLLASAPGGTIFLDELGELPLGTQAKLLRAIEAKEITPVGSVNPQPIDVRFIAATNRPLEEEVAHRRFRADLYFRLNGITLALPPLRERRDEIEPLARMFLADACAQMKRSPVPLLEEAALAWLREYDWPGNIRELKNVVERAVVLAIGDVIGVEHLPLERARVVVAPPTGDFLSLADADRRLRVEQVLDECAGNQTRAAALLGISRKTLVQLLDKYGLARPRKR